MKSIRLNKRFILFLILVGLLLLIPGQSVFAHESVSYSGSNVGAPEWVRPFADGSCCSGIGPVRYTVQDICVLATGQYDILSVQDSFDGYLFIYEQPFNPATQTVNFVGGDDDFIFIGQSLIESVTLYANTQYTIVTTGFANGNEGSFVNTITGDVAVKLGECGAESVALDGRINRFDGAAPIAVYANSVGGVDIYTISGGNGTFLLRTTDMADAACDGSMIAGEGAVGVYRTADCTFQINAPQYNGKTYVLRFDVVSGTADYTSYEEE
jgi:hypothetical protein